jgi:hypothetical protein
MTVTYSGLTVVGGTVITSVWGNMVRDGIATVFASAGTRDATITAPEEGNLAYLADVNQITYYNGSAWLYLVPTGVSTPGTDSTLTAGTTTSTSFTDTLTGAGGVSVAFTAPQSGRVLVLLSGKVSNSGANASYLSWRLSGATTVDATDEWSLVITGTTVTRAGVSYMHSGLTANGSYTCTVQHRVAAGTGTFDDRTLIVVPLN